MSVELRLSDVDPPAEEPKRTIYTDLVPLPDPVKLGLTVRIFNFDAVNLYMRVDASLAPWAFVQTDVGILNTGTNKYYNLDEFGSRAKPAAATEETVTLRLRAYTDAGYLTLKWTYELEVDVVFIKSDDGSWTLDELDDFDDGTVQGWVATNEQNNDGGFPTLAVANDFVLSAAWSLKMVQRRAAAAVWLGARISKSFTTQDRPTVYAVADLRASDTGLAADGYLIRNVYVRRGATLLLQFGAFVDWLTDGFPRNKWFRVVTPLPRNELIEVQIAIDGRASNSKDILLWMDDFRILSKN